MKTLSKSKKKKIIIAVSIVLVIAILATVFGIYAKVNNREKVSLNTVGTGSIVESVGATGKVTSGMTKKYSVATIATVKEVFVETGDVVKQGDTLATFDTTEIDNQISKVRKSYNEAKDEYAKAVAEQKQAKKNLAEMDSEIAALEKSIASQRKTIEDGADSQAKAIEKLIADFQKALSNVSDNEETVNQITEIVLNTIAEEIAKGNTSPEDIANKVENAINKAIANGDIDVSNLNSDISVIVNMIEKQLNSVDWSNFETDIANNAVVKLTSDEFRLAALTAQREIYGAAGSIDLVSTRKDLMDTTKEALDMLEQTSKELAAGWIADFDGTITSCDLKQGEQTSAFAAGLTLQNTEQLVVTISIGEYDINKINVGMEAVVTTAYGEYTGTVISKAPTATGGSESSIFDSIGSMAGIGGLSSLTDKGAGVEVVVAVNEPDENIIIGFNADVEITTGTHDDIVIVPIESVIHEKTGVYVYLYNEEEKTVTKTKVEVGATSTTDYQIISGLSVGDRIVDVPLQTYQEETFDVKVEK